jgi:hypothetical protein
MYGNAPVLVIIGLCQTSWARARITVLVITIFAIAAMIITFLNLAPFKNIPGTTSHFGSACT